MIKINANIIYVLTFSFNRINLRYTTFAYFHIIIYRRNTLKLLMVYFDYRSIFYSDLAMFGWSFMFLFLLTYGLLSSSGIFGDNNNKTMRKIKGLLSLLISIIALYYPSTRLLIFKLISSITSLVLVIFGAIVVIYMAGKVVINKEVKGESWYKEKMRKIQKYLLYSFLGISILGAIYLLGYNPLFGSLYFAARENMAKIFGTGVILLVIYFIIIRPLWNEAKGNTERKQIEKVKELMDVMNEKEAEEDAKRLEKISDAMRKQGIDPNSEVGQVLMHKLLKELNKHK